MNAKNINQFWPLLEAMKAGKTIQCMTLGGEWVKQGDIAFSALPEEYRIKPEIVHYRPNPVGGTVCCCNGLCQTFTGDKSQVTCPDCIEKMKQTLPVWCKVGAKVFAVDQLTEIVKINDIGNPVVLFCGEPHHILITVVTPAVPDLAVIFNRPALVIKSRNDGDYRTILGSSKHGEFYVSGYGNGLTTLAHIQKHFTWADGSEINHFRPATAEEIKAMEDKATDNEE